ncbi:helix-turn-helix domain-containing protein [Luteolibacter ambystomatis]|uniref:Helix-turn-helix domain-containing protein n=1 Tax=Luteolibacter ambystomatis TaxID=2824561 RepID=A0A975J389_9BACT|nr:helix-turn-helix domain-containing protein [Luteolibacter ambystomatis]QUE53136.1 helix-turn-helix domain-containing protein [Luteolibacter ambystomatis]
MALASYERLMTTSPHLLWATERSWDAAEAREREHRYEGGENTCWFVQEGRARVTMEDGTMSDVLEGQWLFLRPGLRHQEFGGPFRFLSIGLRWRWPNGLHLFEKGLPRVAAENEVPELQPAARDVIARTAALVPRHHHYLTLGETSLAAFGRLAALAGDWAAAFAVAMERLEIGAELLEDFDPRLEAMHRMLGTLPLDKELPAAVIEAATGLSERQLNRLSRAAGGRTLREAFENRRYEYAREALLEPGGRVKTVASALGFTDLALFNRWFRRRSGRNPREVRGKMQS